MAKKVAKFMKVSYEQFKKDLLDSFGRDSIVAMKTNDLIPPDEQCEDIIEEVVRKIYNNIKLPKRATVGSAGYDFFMPVTVNLLPGKTVKIPTGIRCEFMEYDWVLKIYPRSGLGFKYREQLDNTVGIIDADYFNANNEGHIMLKITNDTHEEKIALLEDGKGFAQGIFVEYGVTVDDDTDGVRIGGFGSTTK